MTESYLESLQTAHELVEKVIADNKVPIWKTELSKFECSVPENANFTPATIDLALETIVSNIPSSKYIFSIVITACIKKIVDPGQDIRIAQTSMANGYSNRSLDQTIVTPFLKRFNYTHCEASGLESGRNLERPHPWDLTYACNPRGRGNRESFLAVLDFMQKSNGDPKQILNYLLYLDALNRKQAVSINRPPLETNIEKIMHVLNRHFAESSGQGKSRLPVLALYSLYEPLVSEVGRYKGTVLEKLERHTTADLRSGSIGDIQVNKDSLPFEGIEVKSEKSITADMIYELVRKFGDKKISRYYLLTTFPGSVKHEDKLAVSKALETVQKQTGCQVIVNGLNRSIWYYLRLISNPALILDRYSSLIAKDQDVRPELIETWNLILKQEYSE